MSPQLTPVAVALLTTPTPTISWVGSSNGFWDDASNWRDSSGIARTPTASDNVLIDVAGAAPIITMRNNQAVNSLVSRDALSITSGTLTLATASEIDGTLGVTNANLAIGGMLATKGSSNFNNAILTGSGSLLNTGTLSFTGSDYTASTIDNSGTLNGKGGSLQLDYFGTGSLNNTGLVDLQGDASITSQAWGDSFTNSGTFRKSGGIGTSSVTSTFINNGGTVDAESGTLTVGGVGYAGTSAFAGGMFTAGAGAVLSFNGRTTLTGTFTGGGAGQVRFLASNDTYGWWTAGNGGATFNFSSPAVQLSGKFNANGTTFSNTGYLSLSPSSGAATLFGDWTNSGTIAQLGNTALDYAATVNNTATGVWDLQGDYNLYPGGAANSTAASFTNQGTLRKSVGTGSSTVVGGAFSNAGGTIDVRTGTLALGSNGGQSTSGNFQVATGAKLDLTNSADTSGNVVVSYGGLYTGGGGGTVQLAGNVLASSGTGATFNLPAGMFQWTGGGIAGGAVGVRNLGTIDISGSATKTLGGTLRNDGTINLKAGGLQFDDLGVGTLDNHSLVDIQGDFAFTHRYADAPAMDNSGTLRKSGGGTVSLGPVTLNNQGGTVDVQAGILRINGGTQNGGTFNAASGTELQLAGTHTLAGAFSGSGAGAVRLDGDLYTVSPTGASFNFQPGLLRWNSGHIDGGSAGLLNIGSFSRADDDPTASTTLPILAGLVNNAGNFTVNGYSFGMYAGSVFTNRAGAQFDLQQGNELITINTEGGGSGAGPLFINQGTLRKSAAGTSIFALTGFDTSGGTVDVETGTLTFDRGTVTGGSLKVAAGAILDLADSSDTSGNVGVTYSGHFTGSGTGTVALAGNVLFAGSAGASFNLPDGMFQWSGGVINGGTAGFDNQGSLSLVGSSTKAIGGLIINDGTVHQQSGNVQLDYTSGSTTLGGTLQNNGLWDLQSDGGFTRQYLVGGVAVNNAGTLRKSGGTGVAGSGYGTPFNNMGTVEVRSGTLNLLDAAVAQISGTTLTGGQWIVGTNSSLKLPGAIASNQGNVTLDGAGSSFDALNPLSTNAGSLNVLRGRNFATAGNLTNTGTLTLDAGSALNVAGTYTQGSAATLATQIGGNPASGQFGRLVSGGNATLDGNFKSTLVNGFGPTGGDSFQVMQFPSHTGSFASVTLPTSAGGTLFSSTLSNTGFTLNAQASAADLAVGTITLPSGTLAPGQQASLDITVNNIGGLPASGGWTDSVYLSTDAALDPGDILLARVQHSTDVAAGASYHDVVNAALPGVPDGAYHVIVVADSRGQVNDPNRVNNTGVSTGTLVTRIPALQIGQTATGQLGDGQDTWYHLVVPPGANLDISATAGPAGAQVYLRYGTLPSRSDYDQTTSTTAADAKLRLSNAQGGDYYVLLHGLPNGGAAQTYTLSAKSASFAVTDFGPEHEVTPTPNRYILLQGSQFTQQTRVSLVASDGTIYYPGSVNFVDSTRVEATFDLSAVPLGSYTVRATDGAQVANASSTLDIVSVPIGNFASSTILTPSVVHVGAPIPMTVTVHGVNGLAVPVPFLQVDSTNVSSDKHLDLVDPKLPELLGPGGSMDFGHLFFPSPKAAHVVSDFNLSQVNLLKTIDWDAQKDQMRPKGITPEAWDAIWANLRPLLGNIVGDFYRQLEIDAAALAANGVQVNNIGDLLGFEIMKANAQMAPPVKPSSLDLSLPSPGLALNFGRSFLGDSIAGRYTLGRLGRGWVDSFDFFASTDAATQVVTIRDGAATRYFAPGSNGSFVGKPGDSGTLTLVNGAYQLREKTGALTVFHADGTLDYLQDPNHNRITASYTNGQMTRLTHTDGDTITLAYNAQGRLAQVADSAGRTAVYGYDASGQELLSVTTAEGTTQYSYTADTSGPQAYALTSIANPDGTHVFYDYDTQGRLKTTQLDGGAQALAYTYDAASMRITDAQNNSATLKFDGAGRVIRTDGAQGQISQTQYNVIGQVAAKAALGGGVATFGYDAMGNATQLTDPTGASLNLTYNPTANGLAQFTDARGNGFNNAFDANGNATRTTMADGSTASYAYDAMGNLVQSVDRNGLVTRTSYNSRGQVTQIVAADGSTTTYTYDAHANLATATNASGTIAMSYDGADRMTRIAYPDGRFLQYSYNTKGQRTQMVDNAGFTTNYGYDAVGRLVAVTDAAGQLIARYSYDTLGHLVRKDEGNGNHTAYSYDASGQLTRIDNIAADGSVNSSYAYSYDLLGRRTSLTTTEGTTSYGYDGDSRLTSVTLPDGRVIAYSYDAAGNRVQVNDAGSVSSYTTNNLNEYTSAAGAANTFDSAGNLVASTGPSGTSAYTYDALGRLLTVTNAGGTWTYEYDALGNRSASVHNGQRTEYLVDPSGLGNVVGTYDGSGALTAHYTYGLGLTSQVAAGNQASYYDFDANGSTVGLSSAAGSYVNSYSYLPFGELRSATQGVANPFQFGGAMGVQADGSGLSFMRARYYDSNQGRFMQADPLGLVGSTNAYSYGSNNPVNRVDPSGLASTNYQFGFGAGGAFTVGVVVNDNGSAYLQVGFGVGVGGGYSVTESPADASDNSLGYSLSFGGGYATGGYDYDPASGAITPNVGLGGAELGVSYTVNTTFLLWSATKPTAPTAPSIAGPFAPELLDDQGQLTACIGSQEDLALEQFDAACSAMPKLAADPVGTVHTEQRSPSDPNFISGPAGFGTAQFVRNDALLPYEIGFENKPSASAPAQQVVITQQLDPNLDLSTFQLGGFGFGSVNVDVPTGRQFYSTRLDERSTLGLFVDATASLDTSSRTVTWTLTAIVPGTLDLPADASIGFLPPDDATGRGEGYASYYVQPKAGLASGAVVNAQASIVFDTNAPVATNVFTNALDADAPTSRVSALPATTNTASFNLAWSGGDGAGSGIASYDIYVSTDGGAFVPLLQATTQTSTVFNGSDGHRYGFYSVATDNVGRQEAPKTAADASTVVPLQPPVIAGLPGPVAFTEGGPPVLAAPALVVTDADSAQLVSATVAIASGVQAGDSLSATTAGTAITASYDPKAGVLTLSGAATVAAYQTVLDSVAFASSSQNPTAYGTDISRGLNWQVSAGTLSSSVVASTINVVGVDQAPVISGAGNAVTFTQGGAAVAVGPAITLSDVDNLALSSARVSISAGLLPGDLLAANTAGTTIAASYDATAGVLTLAGSDTVAHYQQVLDTVSFQSTSANPSNSGSDTSRQVAWQVSDGTLVSAAAGATSLVRIQPTLLQVTALTPTADGFHVAFSEPIATSALNLYDGQGASFGAADLGLFDATGKRIAGSLVVDADRFGLTFVKTGSVLAPGSYTVTLDSRSDAFTDTQGRLLDGNGDGIAGGNYVGSFNVASSSTATLSVGEIARGPGQSLAIPAVNYGFPVVLDGAAGATRVAFTLQYDPSLLQVSGLSAGALPAGSSVQTDTSTPGLMRVTIQAGAPLPTGRIVLGRLDATVPMTAPYRTDGLLHLTNLQLDGGARAMIGADGVLAVGYIGDASGDMAYSKLDFTLMNRVLLNQDSGFGAWPLVDPTVIGDIDRNGVLQSADAMKLALQIAGIPQKDIPQIPTASSATPSANPATGASAVALGGPSVPAAVTVQATPISPTASHAVDRSATTLRHAAVPLSTSFSHQSAATLLAQRTASVVRPAEPAAPTSASPASAATPQIVLDVRSVDFHVERRVPQPWIAAWLMPPPDDDPEPVKPWALVVRRQAPLPVH
ncbi:RHS repeat-associated core domain-containing protein [Roseateles saccharophilus]|uniref:RHS repeat-associated core domain-containing protein n=1 Tax=Roseateles saccharophilus TaxID=304 RepID=UPI001FB30B74|nr:RHS repeat-associated core domain-containing protein [Roseateles saccharophilus]